MTCLARCLKLESTAAASLRRYSATPCSHSHVCAMVAENMPKVEEQHLLGVNVWTANFLMPFMLDGKKHSCFDRIFWTLLSVMPLLSVVLAEYIFSYYVENIVFEAESTAVSGTGEYADWVGWDWQLTHICVFIMAASMMSKELLPAVHMMRLERWASRSTLAGERFRASRIHTAEEIHLLSLRLYLAVRFFNAAGGHITFSKEMEDQILNTAMVFVLEIDEVILDLTLSPDMINLLGQVPAVSGDLPGLGNSLFAQSASIFVKSQFFQGCVWAFGVLWCAIYAQVWMTVSADMMWEALWLVRPAPYFVAVLTALAHKLAARSPSQFRPGKLLTLPRKRPLKCPVELCTSRGWAAELFLSVMLMT